MEKTKEKGNIKRTGHIIANGVQFLNGDNCSRNAKVPIIVMDYDTPDRKISLLQYLHIHIPPARFVH
jgi:hypothetical protein